MDKSSKSFIELQLVYFIDNFQDNCKILRDEK